jgi:hypothetical protein
MAFYLAAMLIPCALAADTSLNSSRDWVYLKGPQWKIGVIRSSGGGIGYFSRAGSSKNLLNHYDRGRLVQQSYYGDADGSRWEAREWNYNPVQGGDYRGKSAPVMELKETDGSLYVKSRPLHWATGMELPCEMEQWITPGDDVVEVRYQFTYSDTKAHAPRHQELPAVFLDASLDTLVTYDGSAPWTGAPVVKLEPGPANEYIKITENWLAYVNKKGEGVGIYVPGVTDATCYRFRGKGARDLDCSYAAPIATFALTPGLKCSYQAYLTIGTVEEIRERFSRLHAQITEGSRPGGLRLERGPGR